MSYKPIDITNSWVEDNLSEVVFRYLNRIDPKDRKLLLLYRILGVKYRMLHTLKSHFKSQLIVEEEVRNLVDLFVLEAGLNYMTNKEQMILY